VNSTPADVYRPLGSTGLYCHPLGFGCYRIADGNSEHEAALRRYLDRGGNLIDTSANYTDGQSEILVGKVLRNHARENAIVVTKAGYIQGQNMRLALTQSFPEVVKYGEGLWHCIHPEFLETQLFNSSQRMQLDMIDVFLLHNPEYYLNHQAHFRTPGEEDHREFYRRIGRAFSYLEEKAKEGKIRWYGISSNNFGLPRSDPTMTSVHRCLQEAEAVSPEHHFRVVQLPMNLYETGGALEPNIEGLSVLDFCDRHGLGVLVNRPLNAFYGNQMLRLADFTRPGQNPPGKKELDELLRPLRELEEDLVRQLNIPLLGGHNSGLSDLLERLVPQVKSADHWEQVAGRYVIGPVQQWLQTLRHTQQGNPIWDDWLEQFLQLINPVFEAIERFLRAQQQPLSDEIRKRLLQAGYPETEHTLSQVALGILISLNGVSCVLNGMRRLAYVNDALGALHLAKVNALSVLQNFSRQL
jgi:aryl-alcohol dehydrogenase-like predicted oxidoreductase